MMVTIDDDDNEDENDADDAALSNLSTVHSYSADAEAVVVGMMVDLYPG